LKPATINRKLGVGATNGPRITRLYRTTQAIYKLILVKLRPKRFEKWIPTADKFGRYVFVTTNKLLDAVICFFYIYIIKRRTSKSDFLDEYFCNYITE